MGNYIPPGTRQKRTLADTLQESEYEHYLDCPSADFLTRFAGTFLDFILCSIAWSAIGHVTDTIAAAVLSLSRAEQAPTWAAQSMQYGQLVLKVTFVYLYFVWSAATYGGTAGKILLGMRVIDFQSGQRLSLPRALLRESVLKALSIITVFGILLPVFRKDRRTLHDLLAGSGVKRIRGEP